MFKLCRIILRLERLSRIIHAFSRLPAKRCVSIYHSSSTQGPKQRRRRRLYFDFRLRLGILGLVLSFCRSVAFFWSRSWASPTQVRTIGIFSNPTCDLSLFERFIIIIIYLYVWFLRIGHEALLYVAEDFLCFYKTTAKHKLISFAELCVWDCLRTVVSGFLVRFRESRIQLTHVLRLGWHSIKSSTLCLRFGSGSLVWVFQSGQTPQPGASSQFHNFLKKNCKFKYSWSILLKFVH